ncbi:MAG: AI-2E family transporter [Kaiparowitsia implicata GSE-PSE-MK54-09C]|jgi:predicted PurR-regulated permease PerM|nr:AI-2E family transporter [Kaiparowitsia implicata GSE-PSE-MK54-09C]
MSESKFQQAWNHLDNSKLVRYVLLAALAWAVTQVLAYFESVLIIFIFAAVLAFLLHYPVRWLTRFMPHSAAVLVVSGITLLVVLGLVATFGLALLSQAQQLDAESSGLAEVGVSVIDGLQQLFERWNIDIDLSTIEEQVRDQVLAGIAVGLGAVQSVASNLVNLIFITVIAFFMLLDGQRLWRLLLRALPEAYRDRVAIAIQQNFLGFFWGRLLLSLFFGLSALLLFLLLQVPFPLVLAVIVGLFDLIPGIGATLGITLAGLILLPQGVVFSVKVIAVCIVLQQVEENLLLPRIMQGSLNINPVVMFFALLVGARVAGLVGVFLSIPIAGVMIGLFDLKAMQGKDDTDAAAAAEPHS